MGEEWRRVGVGRQEGWKGQKMEKRIYFLLIFSLCIKIFTSDGFFTFGLKTLVQVKLFTHAVFNNKEKSEN